MLASPRSHRRSGRARLTFPVVHEPSEVCPRPQPHRVTTVLATLALRSTIPGAGPAPAPRVVPACTGKLEPTEVGLHVPAAPWSATAADESTAMQVCDRDPRPESRTCAAARFLRSDLRPLRERWGFRTTGAERSPPWRCSADEYMMPNPYGPDIRSFHGFCPLRGSATPSPRSTCAADFPTRPMPALGELGAEARRSKASHRPSADRPAQSPLRFGAPEGAYRRAMPCPKARHRAALLRTFTSRGARTVPDGKAFATSGCGSC